MTEQSKMPDKEPEVGPGTDEKGHATFGNDQLFLKNGASILITTHNGVIDPSIPSTGLFTDDMAIIARFSLTLNGTPLEKQQAKINESGTMIQITSTNGALTDRKNHLVTPGNICMKRNLVVDKDNVYEKIILYNTGQSSIGLSMEAHYETSFDDIFERRNVGPLKRRFIGKQNPAVTGKRSVAYTYDGFADEAGTRRTQHASVQFSGRPSTCDNKQTTFHINLEPGDSRTLYVRYGNGLPDISPLNEKTYKNASENAVKDFETKRYTAGATVTSSDPEFNEWLQTSQNDLAHLVREYETGPYPHAGIPWFNTMFGRDGIITAQQMLWLNPNLAKGVLKGLAARQAQTTDPFHSAEPGKIMHEARLCEMARTNEIPYETYYGGVDTTPLFIMLAADYYRRTGDIAFIKELKTNLNAANQWIENHMNVHPLGFLSYKSDAKIGGLPNQGWKDSPDGVFHEDGSDPSIPIALCEVQGYVYAAWQGMADLQEALQEPAKAQAFRQKAKDFATDFDKHFWDKNLGTYVMAIDGNSKSCRVRSSNTGHLLWTGIVPESKASLVRDKLMGPDSFSGYGLRTVEQKSARYDPLSYHNGAVWAHDTAIAAMGLANYGLVHDSEQILGGLYEAAKLCPKKRLPELFGGQEKDGPEDLAWYPAACAPQAWAAGSLFMALQAVTGLDLKLLEQQADKNNNIILHTSSLPTSCGVLSINNLQIGKSYISLQISPANYAKKEQKYPDLN